MAVASLRALLERACGSPHFVEAVARHCPFADVESLLRAVDAALQELEPADWRQALLAERTPEVVGGDAGTRAAAALAVNLYRDRFGYAFVVAAQRPSADELLMRVRIRLGNDAEAELRTAAGELRRIVRARLRRMLEEESGTA
jgi:2-oxo-4-hydroxy-4-carboxy-5-ureidoimidazoline decarboxylase